VQESYSLTTYFRSIRLIRRDAGLSLVAQASLGFSYFGVYAVLFNLYLLRLGYDLRYISSINATGQLVFAISSLIVGFSVKRSSNRQAMILGMSINLLAFSVLPLIRWDQISNGDILLVITYALTWLGLALVIVNIIPFLISSTGTEERSMVFGMVGAVLSLSGFFGNLLGGLLPGYFVSRFGGTLNSPTPFRYTLLLVVIFIIPGLLALIATRDTKIDTPMHEKLRNVGKVPFGLIVPLTLVMLLMRTGEGSVRTFFNVYLETSLGESTALIAILSAAGQLLAIPAALATPILVKTLNLRRTLIMGILGMACSLVPLAFFPNWGAAGLGFLGIMALTSFTVPAFGIYHQENLPKNWRTVMSGTATMAVGLSWAVTSYGGGFLITNFGYRTFFITVGILTLCGGLLFRASTLRLDSD
jgi:predicted MFS family arabinose efflux permease